MLALIAALDINVWEFYDLETDPAEMRNRINDPEVQNIVARMKTKLELLHRRYRDDDGPAVDAPLIDTAAIAKGRQDADRAAGAGHNAAH